MSIHEIELKKVGVSKRSLNIKLDLSESPGYSVIWYVDGTVQLLCSSAVLTRGLQVILKKVIAKSFSWLLFSPLEFHIQKSQSLERGLPEVLERKQKRFWEAFAVANGMGFYPNIEFFPSLFFVGSPNVDGMKMTDNQPTLTRCSFH